MAIDLVKKGQFLLSTRTTDERNSRVDKNPETATDC